MVKVLIIIGSGRKVRNTPILANAIYSIAKASSPEIDYELVDLKEWNLPYDSEVDMAALGKYSSETTLAWSKLVDESQGFIIISPQYNWGYPAILKNALDHLYKEWANKPVGIVTFGGHGGNKCNKQLQEVAEGFNMIRLKNHLEITITKGMILNGITDIESLIDPHKAGIENLLTELSTNL